MQTLLRPAVTRRTAHQSRNLVAAAMRCPSQTGSQGRAELSHLSIVCPQLLARSPRPQTIPVQQSFLFERILGRTGDNPGEEIHVRRRHRSQSRRAFHAEL